MLKNISQLEVTINEKSVRLLTDMDTDINVVEAALKQFQLFIDQIREAATKAESEKTQEAA